MGVLTGALCSLLFEIHRIVLSLMGSHRSVSALCRKADLYWKYRERGVANDFAGMQQNKKPWVGL